MFDLAEKRLAWIPIKWKGVTQTSPDAVAEACDFEIEVLAEIVDNDAFRDIFAEAPDDVTAPTREEETKTNLEKFKRVVHDWRRVKFKGEPAEFNDENIMRMLRVPMFIIGYETSYLKAWMGQPELAAKNSAGSSASGQEDAGGPSKSRTTRKSRKPRR